MSIIREVHRDFQFNKTVAEKWQQVLDCPPAKPDEYDIERCHVCESKFSRGQSTCMECHTPYRPTDSVVPLWFRIAAELGHGWTTNPGAENSRNLCEVAALNIIERWCFDWGYNPPLTYKFKSSEFLPGWITGLSHSTKKQRFQVGGNSISFWVTTTRGVNVGSGLITLPDLQGFGGYFIIDAHVDTLEGRPDRLYWAHKWATTFNLKVGSSTPEGYFVPEILDPKIQEIWDLAVSHSEE